MPLLEKFVCMSSLKRLCLVGVSGQVGRAESRKKERKRQCERNKKESRARERTELSGL